MNGLAAKVWLATAEPRKQIIPARIVNERKAFIVGPRVWCVLSPKRLPGVKWLRADWGPPK